MNSNDTNRTILIAILMVLVFGIGFLIGRVTANQDMGDVSDVMNSSENSDNNSGALDNTSGSNVDLTEGQRNMLSSMGINPDQVNITAEMVACAEAKLGSARITEIQNGATPTMSEGVSLMACYK